eukprot:Skav222299  [mRNA]  locus=scaffold3734:238273:241903:- [translate_table: standard]
MARGLGSFYAGISAAWLRQATFGTLRHGLYGVVEARGRDEDTGQARAPRGGADAAWPPAQRRGYRHALHGLHRVARREGPAALWRGAQPTALRAALVTCAQLATYEELKGALVAGGWGRRPGARLRQRRPAAPELRHGQRGNGLRGHAAGGHGGVHYRGPWDVVVKTFSTEGPLAFYKGLSATFVRLWPHTVLLWLGQEVITSHLRGDRDCGKNMAAGGVGVGAAAVMAVAAER